LPDALYKINSEEFVGMGQWHQNLFRIATWPVYPQKKPLSPKNLLRKKYVRGKNQRKCTETSKQN